jgi:hypothetical protein
VELNFEWGPTFQGGIPLATFADDRTGHQGYGAITIDRRGSGRVIQSATHAELNKRTAQDCKLVAKMTAWAAGV